MGDEREKKDFGPARVCYACAGSLMLAHDDFFEAQTWQTECLAIRDRNIDDDSRQRKR